MAAAGTRNGGGGPQTGVGGRQYYEYAQPPTQRPATQGSQHTSSVSGGPLDSLARALGVQDRVVKIPAIFNAPARDVQAIYIILAAIIVLIFGWQAAVGILLFYYVSSTSTQQ